jgi:hypothetical protein
MRRGTNTKTFSSKQTKHKSGAKAIPKKEKEKKQGDKKKNKPSEKINKPNLDAYP